MLAVLAYRTVDQTSPIELYAQRGSANTTATIAPSATHARSSPSYTALGSQP
jgi:hypothetical protein